MATRTQVMLSCDVCGKAKDVQTRAFGLDGKAYEIDLCPADSKGLSRLAAGYMSKARKITSGHSSRRNGRRPRPGTAAGGGRVKTPGVKISGRGRATGPQEEAEAGRRGQQAAETRGTQPEKGIYVYGILPADIEIADQMPGVGEHPGMLRIVYSDGVAALISEVDLPKRLGSPADRRTHREILDAAASELPVLPLRFGTVLASEDQVSRELLAAHHEEFAAALHELEGRAEYVVKGRYLEQAVLGEAMSQNPEGARLQEAIDGQDPDAAADARAELSEILNEAVTARRNQDTRALEQAMQEVCLASVVRKPAHELDAVNIAFLADTDRESDLEQVIQELAQAWEGRIQVRLLGPMAAYDFAAAAAPEG